MKKLFTSESVTEGHPDKLCDQIADAILDEILLRDPDAHVACEVVTTKELVHIIIRWIFIELLKKIKPNFISGKIDSFLWYATTM